MIFTLTKSNSALITESTYAYFRAFEGNISEATEASDSYREILSDQLNIYNTTISNKLNDVMKFLTVFSAFFFAYFCCRYLRDEL
jgi:magnesium transporter